MIQPLFYEYFVMKKNRLHKQLKKKFCGVIVYAFVFNQAWLEQVDAEQLDTQVDVERLDSMVITGTHIPAAAETTPVVIMDRKYIDQSGATTVNELFKKFIYNAAGTIDEQFTQGSAPASSGINLRGVGLSRTLVLLDGRRLPIFPFAQSTIGKNSNDSFVDINLIPLSAVERIEIIKDGASSAVYGSDAVAGVVNIITHKDYDGTMLAGQFGSTLKGDGKEGRAEIVAGKTWEDTNFTFAFDYFNRNEVRAEDRDISKSALGPFDNRSNAGNPGTIINLAGGGPPSPDPRCPPDQVSGFFCKFDFAPFNTLIPEVERIGVMASFDHQINNNINLFVRGLYAHTESQRSLAPAPINDLLIVTPDNPNNPRPGDLLGVIYRFSELGPRIDEFETNAYNFVGGFNGEVVDWDWEVGFGIGNVNTTSKGTNGYATQTSLQQAVDNGDLNPFGDSPTFNPSSVMMEPKREGNSKIYYLDINTNGTLFDKSYGALDMAVGADFRREKFSDSFDPITTSGDVVGIGGTSGNGSRNIQAAYFELFATVLEQVEMQFSGRMDHYSDLGATFNPKFSLRWQPLNNLVLRGNVGTGFKAPALHELYSGEINSFDSIYDPVKQTVTEVDLVTSGNPDLDAEEAFTYGLGFALDVTNWWQLSLDYWHIRNDSAVISSPQFYVDNEALFPNNVIRNDSGDIVAVVSPFENVAGQKVWGLDMNTGVNWGWSKIGDFRLDVGAAYLGSFKEEAAPGSGFIDFAGYDGIPHWRSQGRLTWSKSDYEISLTANYIAGYTRRSSKDNVGGWTTLDLQGMWRPNLLHGGTVAVGSENILNAAPPEDPDFEGWPFFNRALTNPRGRFLYLRLQYEF